MSDVKFFFEKIFAYGNRFVISAIKIIVYGSSFCYEVCIDIVLLIKMCFGLISECKCYIIG